MKLLILTITSTNYGNRLQNYAVNHLLKSISMEPENLVVYNFLQYDKSLVKKSIKRLLPICVLKKVSDLIHEKRNALDDRKDRLFQEFSERYMDNRAIYVHTSKELSRKIKGNPYVLVGSDQIWNPDFAGLDYFFADFTVPEKRIALSASIGYTELSGEIQERYTKYCNRMKYISVREESAADLIEKATGRRPDVYLDPTLLLTREEWDEIEQVPKCQVPDSYILCLFLGNVPEDITKIYEKAYGMKCVVLNDKNFPEHFLVDPSEFIWMIKNSSLILTDSFHCTVFSIIYHKDFVVFEREDPVLKNMFTRMETLLSRFDLLDRIQKNGEPLCLERIEEERFLASDEIRAEERERVIRKLQEVIERRDQHETSQP